MRNGGRKMSRSTSHETKIDVPPAKGVKLKTDGVGLWVTDELAVTAQRNQLTAGRWDHRPVQETTTAISTMMGNQTESPSAGEPGWNELAARTFSSQSKR